MSTLLLTHPACLGHEPGPHHPERPDRLRAVLAALDDEEFAGLAAPKRRRPRWSSSCGCIRRDYVQAILGVRPAPGRDMRDRRRHRHEQRQRRGRLARRRCRRGRRRCGDGGQGRHRLRRGPAARPSCRRRRVPGASACSTTSRSARAMPRRAHGVARVAIVDFDVHHGQGTQAMFERRPAAVLRLDAPVSALSRHRPARERGIDGNVANVPLRPGSGSAAVPRRPGATPSCRSSTASHRSS